jgi:hypothetical protein
LVFLGVLGGGGGGAGGGVAEALRMDLTDCEERRDEQ